MDIRHNPWLGIKLLRESHLETLNVFASRMEVAMKEVHSALTRAADYMADFYDAYQREAPLYMVRGKVWLNGKNITTTCLMKKLDHKWLGLYPVDKVIMKCIPTQNTIVIQLNPPCILSDPAATLQCGHHCRVSST